MARASKLDPCMICDEAPCVCGRKVKTTPAPRKRAVKSATTEVPVVKVSPADAMRLAALSKVTKPAPIVEVLQVATEHEIPITDPEFRVAVRALADLLHTSELSRYSSIVRAEPDATERALIWKGKRRGLELLDSEAS